MKSLTHTPALILAAVVCTFLIGCDPTPSAPTNAATDAGTDLVRQFNVKGIVRELSADRHSATVAHEEIPDFMPAMVMVLTVKDSGELDGLGPGDEIVFRLNVTKDDDWIDQIVKTGRAVDLPHVGVGTLTVGEELDVGDLVPDITLTNDVNQIVRLSDLRGKTVALTFIFTRCPLPTYCPLMSRNFADAHQILMDSPGKAKDWRFLSISFDPEFDTPKVLHIYAGQYRPLDHQWDFLTTSESQIQSVGAPLGLRLIREPGTISHNLRTVVIGKDGRIRHVFRDNLWKGEELAAAVTAADSAYAAVHTAQLSLTGMSCQACADTIQSGLLNQAGVVSAQVSLTNRLATVRYVTNQASVDQLVGCVTNLNYGAAPVR